MRIVLFLFVWVFSSFAFCSDRVKVSDNSDETTLTDLVKSLACSFEAENLNAYQMCFKESRRPSVRRQAALMFVEGQCSMDILEMHVIEVSEGSASAFVRYKMASSSEPVEFLSELKFLKENGRWVVDREVIKSRQRHSSSSYASSGGPKRPAAARWNPMKPDADLISPNLDHLVGDIGIREGKGCSGGNCPGGRCFVK